MMNHTLVLDVLDANLYNQPKGGFFLFFDAPSAYRWCVMDNIEEIKEMEMPPPLSLGSQGV